MIEAKNVVKTFDGFKALDGLTMTVPQGSIYGLVGPNGAGKSTLLRHVTGVYRQDSGSVLLDGNPIYENPAAKARIADIPDELYYFLSASTRDMMRFYKGFYPRFDTARYEALKDVFTNVDERQPIRACPRVCRSNRPSGWPCAAGRRCWCWMSRWTVWTR